MIIYIAGPISVRVRSGETSDQIRADFNRRAERYRAAGHRAINPWDLHEETARWVECLRADLRGLSQCDAIALAPGWEASPGARLEKHVAEALGYTVIYE